MIEQEQNSEQLLRENFGNLLKTLRRGKTYWEGREVRVWTRNILAAEMSKYTGEIVTEKKVADLEQGRVVGINDFLPAIIAALNLPRAQGYSLYHAAGYVHPDEIGKRDLTISTNVLNVFYPACIVDCRGGTYAYNELFAKLYALNEANISILQNNPFLLTLFFEESLPIKEHVDIKNLEILRMIALNLFDSPFNLNTQEYHQIQEKLSPSAQRSVTIFRSSNHLGKRPEYGQVDIAHSEFGIDPITFVNMFPSLSVEDMYLSAIPKLWMQVPKDSTASTRFRQLASTVEENTIYEFPHKENKE